MKAHFSRYAETYLYALLFAVAQYLTSYIAEFKPLAEFTPAQLAAITPLAWRLHYAGAALGCIVVLLAFLNKTRARNEQAPTAPIAPKSPAVPSSSELAGTPIVLLPATPGALQEADGRS